MLKVHIGLNLASQMKQLHWSYTDIILDKTKLWQEILCEIGLPLLHLILFQISAHEYLRSRQECLLLHKAMESTSLQATDRAGQGALRLGIPAGMGNATRLGIPAGTGNAARLGIPAGMGNATWLGIPAGMGMQPG